MSRVHKLIQESVERYEFRLCYNRGHYRLGGGEMLQSNTDSVHGTRPQNGDRSMAKVICEAVTGRPFVLSSRRSTVTAHTAVRQASAESCGLTVPHSHTAYVIVHLALFVMFASRCQTSWNISFFESHSSYVIVSKGTIIITRTLFTLRAYIFLKN